MLAVGKLKADEMFLIMLKLVDCYVNSHYSYTEEQEVIEPRLCVFKYYVNAEQ